MAKSSVNVKLLAEIDAASKYNQPFYVSQADGLPLVQHNPPLIAVDPAQIDPNDASKIAAKLTAEGSKALEVHNGHVAQGQALQQPATRAPFQIMSGIEVPKVKRGGGNSGAPTKYPFDDLQVGQFIFVGNTDVSNGNAMKTLSSAVGSANQRYMEETGEQKTVTRAKRGEGNKAVKGSDGKNVMESVTIPVKKSIRKYIVRKVEAGKMYGSFTAPTDGAVAIRDE